ncbi:MAG TPA: hypothetical protein VE954_31640 [Oligoflexus sp.]|uniref:hypothetical protein n=1 Tax=Oligoflexus sp. TaxID=1971216 RepID=UPI002D39B1B7|nr:hypothetical protein [Oligoflexus sp.]HYX37678.1 hypothetical protein [Oligoflexus sp.]
MSRPLLAALLLALLHIFTAAANAESLKLTYSAAFHRLNSIEDMTAIKAQAEREGCQALEQGMAGPYIDEPTLGWLATTPKGIQSRLFRMERTQGSPFYLTFPMIFIETSLVYIDHSDGSGPQIVDLFDGRHILGIADKRGLPTSFPMHFIQPPVRVHTLRALENKASAALQDGPSAEAFLKVKRHMHTAKGLLPTAGQSYLASRLHQVETDIQMHPDDIKIVVASFQNIADLGFAAVQRFLSWNGAEAGMQATRASLLEILANPLRGMAEAARILGKDEPEVQLQGPTYEPLFSTKMAQALTEVFTHAFRNSVDHRIERSAIRQQLGKKPRGRIGIQLSQEPGVCPGRGVGLYAARAALREINADIAVEFTGPRDQDGFRTFQFIITTEAS